MDTVTIQTTSMNTKHSLQNMIFPTSTIKTHQQTSPVCLASPHITLQARESNDTQCASQVFGILTEKQHHTRQITVSLHSLHVFLKSLLSLIALQIKSSPWQFSLGLSFF